MANQADVRSLEQIERLHEQTTALRTRLGKELETLQTEMRRLSTWLEEHASNYWSGENMKARRHLRACEDNLSRCMSYVRSNEQRPCTEEKKRVRVAKERAELCEKKLQFLKIACNRWEAEQLKIRARMKRCHDMSENDLLVAANHLSKQIDLLKQYAGLQSPISASSTNTQPTSQTKNQELPSAGISPPPDNSDQTNTG